LNFQLLISHYGYFAVLISTVCLGNSAAFASGLAANSGVLTYYGTFVAAWLGAFIADQALFYIGLFFGCRINLEKLKPQKREKVLFVKKWLEKSPFLVIILWHYIPGLGTIAPLVFGVLKYSPLKLLIYDLVAITITTAIIVSLGFYAGVAAERILATVGVVGLTIVIILIVTAFIVLKYRKKDNRL